MKIKAIVIKMRENFSRIHQLTNLQSIAHEGSGTYTGHPQTNPLESPVHYIFAAGYISRKKT